MFDDQLLQAYIDTFYGFGNYRGKYWFVGMEEGGGGTFEGIENRIRGWARDGKNEIKDLTGGYDYRTAPKDRPIPKHFAQRPKWQRTWGMLIRILLTAEGHLEPITADVVKMYQRDKLGRPDSDNCLLELLPLPSPSMGHWLYKEHTRLPNLQTREIYKEHYASQRVQCIRKRVHEYKPAVVIFYGMGYRRWWEEIAGVNFTEVSAGSNVFYMGTNGRTIFVMIAHPVAHGVTNDYFHQVGKAVALQLQA